MFSGDSMEIGQLISIDRPDGTSTITDRYWTGQGKVTIDGDEYDGKYGVIQIGDLIAKSGDQTGTMQLVMQGDYQKYINDIGPARTVIRWIYRESISDDWTLVPHVFEGYLNGYRFVDTTIVFRLANSLEDILESPRRYFSNESQQDLFSGDKGFSHMRQLAGEGFKTGWPLNTNA